MKFCTGIAYETTIPHTKQNFKISTDVIDNKVIMFKLGHFRQKAFSLLIPFLNFKLRNNLCFEKINLFDTPYLEPMPWKHRKVSDPHV